MFKKFISSVLIFLLLFSCVSCTSATKEFSKSTFSYFDTVTTISGYFNSQKEFDNCYEIIEKELERYHKLLDAYNNYEGVNNIKTINDNAGKKATRVDKEIIELLDFCVQIYHSTDGALNVCLAPVTQIWKKSISQEKLPQEKQLIDAKQHVSIKNLVINNENLTVYLKRKGAKIDVGSVAKGFVCEKLKQKLVAFGFVSGIINLGGNVLTVGNKPNGERFVVGIEDPRNESEYIYTVSVEDKCVVTSGDYQRYFVKDSVRYHHIISPKTCYPVETKVSVTVISENALIADAFSTALFVMDLKQALKIASDRQDTAVLIIDSDYKEHFSKGFKKYLYESE